MTQTPNTVRAYSTRDWRNGPVETIFYTDANGNVYTSGERPFNNAFNPKGQEWYLVDCVPQWAEFIGNYANPNA